MAEEKKKDGRRNNGAVKGVSRGQGRKPKIKDKAKGGSSKHWDYIMNYRYGKPKEMQQIDINTKVNIPVIDFAQPKTIDITPEDERERTDIHEKKD